MKKFKKFKKWDKVEIEWIDSMGSNGWKSEEHVASFTTDLGLKQLSCGYFFMETPLSISIVLSRSHPDSDSRNVDSSMQIPKVAITKIVKL